MEADTAHPEDRDVPDAARRPAGQPLPAGRRAGSVVSALRVRGHCPRHGHPGTGSRAVAGDLRRCWSRSVGASAPGAGTCGVRTSAAAEPRARLSRRASAGRWKDWRFGT